MSLSLCMITKNEETYLAQSLNSVKDIVDEIIILDTGSTDKTIEIAKQFTNNIFSYKWGSNFAAARNASIKRATKDWILVLDPDEVIDKEDCRKIKQLIKDPQYIAYALIQMSYTHDTTQFTYTPVKEETEETKDFPGYIACNIIRLFKNHQNIAFANPVHESVDTSIKDKNKIKKTDIKIHHYQFEKGNENQREKQLQYLKIYEEKIDLFANKAKVYRDMGIIYYSFKQEYEKAIGCFKKSLEYNSNNLKTYAGLVMCYVKAKLYDEALQVLAEAAKHFPGNQEVQRMKDIVLHFRAR